MTIIFPQNRLERAIRILDKYIQATREGKMVEKRRDASPGHFRQGRGTDNADDIKE
jgi:hypothetical protein